jgi:hypothetical protein
MNREKIIQLASDAGFDIDDPDEYHDKWEIVDNGNYWITDQIESLCHTVEREAFARLKTTEGQVGALTEELNNRCIEQYQLQERLVDAERIAASWANVFGHIGTPDECGNEWSALVAKLEAAEKDAARYRWIRERVGVDFEYGKGHAWMPCGNTKALDYVVETDCAIDAAISAMKESE